MHASAKSPYARLLKLVYVHNPFYLISACLVLYGLHMSLDGSFAGGWMVMSLFCGYGLLLAAVAFVIVRYGQVWEDARSILLIVGLVLVAMSAIFDELVLESVRRGLPFMLVGLGFAIAITEGIVRSLGISFGVAYRAPLYLLFTLLFGYPAWLAHLSISDQAPLMQWAVFLFPALVGLVTLTLLPAATRQDKACPSGTPWGWPWYPWSLFVLLGVATLFRSYGLSLTFEAAKGTDSAFSGFFLTPLLLCGCLLLMQLGITARNRLTCRVALLAPLGTLLLALPGRGSNPVESGFVATLCSTAGGPALLTLCSLITIYAIFWLCRIEASGLALMACVGLLSIVDSHTTSLATLVTPQPVPLLILALLLVLQGVCRHHSVEVAAGGWLAVAVVTDLAGVEWMYPTYGYYPLHVALGLLLGVGLTFHDCLGRWLCRAAPVLVPLVAVLAVVTYDTLFPTVPFTHHLVVAGVLASLSLGYWWRVASMPHLVGLLASLASNAVGSVRQMLLICDDVPGQRGGHWLAWGLMFLAVATFLSLTKAGVVVRAWGILLRWNRRLADAKPPLH